MVLPSGLRFTGRTRTAAPIDVLFVERPSGNGGRSSRLLLTNAGLSRPAVTAAFPMCSSAVGLVATRNCSMLWRSSTHNSRDRGHEPRGTVGRGFPPERTASGAATCRGRCRNADSPQRAEVDQRKVGPCGCGVTRPKMGSAIAVGAWRPRGRAYRCCSLRYDGTVPDRVPAVRNRVGGGSLLELDLCGSCARRIGGTRRFSPRNQRAHRPDDAQDRYAAPTGAY